MAHLIQPIPIEGTPLCVKHGALLPSGGRWRTLAARYDECVLTGAEDDDSWILYETSSSDALYGSLEFGVCCVWKFTVGFYIEPSGGDVIGKIEINGVMIEDFEIYGGTAGELVSFVIDLNYLTLMDAPCGNIVTIYAEINGNTPGISTYLNLVISEVTEGPPV
jgi:hypothetical protein